MRQFIKAAVFFMIGIQLMILGAVLSGPEHMFLPPFILGGLIMLISLPNLLFRWNGKEGSTNE